MDHPSSKNGSSTNGSHAMGRRRLLKTGGAALALTAAGAAAGLPRRAAAQGKAGGTLTFASTALPPNLEPHMQGLDIWQRRKPLSTRTSCGSTTGSSRKPELAERWEQKSPTEYVFHLRRGVRFHNGKEMDAEDVKYTYERVRDPKVSPGANDLAFVKPDRRGRQVHRALRPRRARRRPSSSTSAGSTTASSRRTRAATARRS